MITIHRVLTRLDEEAFAVFQHDDGLEKLSSLLSSPEITAKHASCPVSIVTESEGGELLRGVDLMGLTCDSFVSRKSVLEKYTKLLKSEGVWIPSDEVSDYCIFLARTRIPIIDEAESDIAYFSSSGNVMDISRYSFKYSPMLEDTLLFRSVIAPYRELLCTGEFIDIYESLNGSGLGFKQLGLLE